MCVGYCRIALLWDMFSCCIDSLTVYILLVCTCVLVCLPAPCTYYASNSLSGTLWASLNTRLYGLVGTLCDVLGLHAHDNELEQCDGRARSGVCTRPSIDVAWMERPRKARNGCGMRDVTYCDGSRDASNRSVTVLCPTASRSLT